MRNAILISFLFSLSVFSASALTCTDLTINLSKENESASVLSLQNFLAEKGFLKAKPNGYFGPGTQKAVQSYQKSKKLNPSGSVLALTRAAIKEESCKATTTTSSNSSKTTITKPSATTTVSTPSSSIATMPPSVLIEDMPSISEISKGTVFRRGDTSWGLVITGSKFSTSTANTVYLDDQKSGKRYTVGTFSSLNGKTISLPQSLGSIPLVCGGSCKEILSAGGYYVIVKTPKGGESTVSSSQIISVRDAVIGNAVGGGGIIPYLATSTRLGSFNFTLYNPSKIISLILNSTSSQFASTTLSKIILKDEITTETLPDAAAGIELYEGQYMNVAAYANVVTTAIITKTVPMSFTLTVKDTYDKLTSFTSTPFLVSFDKEPLSVTLAKSTTIPPLIDSLDAATILTNGVTTWGLVLRGKGFDLAANTIYFASRSNRRKYTIGSFPSVNNVITLPQSLGKLTVSCGSGCEETLPPGDYDITVTTKLGESNQKYIAIKSFNISSITGTQYSPIHKKVSGAKLGTVSIGVGTILKVSSITPSINFPSGGVGLSNIVIKDEATGQALVSAGKDLIFNENDSRVYGIYADVNTTSSASGEIALIFDVVDYIANKDTILTSPSFTVSFTTDP